jgi:acyl-CoA synthetase (AMP-forming)/AMP-acid ligase II
VSRIHPHEATTVPQWIDALAETYRTRPCVASDVDTLSYLDLERESAALARGLLAHGIGKGSRVGLLLGNGPAWVTWWAAVSRIGAVCVPMSTFLQPAELARVLLHADLHWLVASRKFLARDFVTLINTALGGDSRLDSPLLALADTPFLRAIVLDESREQWTRDTSWVVDEGRDARWGEVLKAAQREVHCDDEALCIYTSGQSAEPKGVIHTQGSIVGKAHYLRTMFHFTETSNSTATMPFFWVGGLVMALFPTMDAGGVTHCPERSTWSSGAVIGRSTAGSAAAEEHTRQFANIPALGMTETFGIYSWGRDVAVPEYPIAAPLDDLQPGFELRLADEQDGEVGDGVPAQILLRGPTITTRLQKVARSEAFDADGFYRTGDLGVREGDRIFFAGRMHDMIKTSGANVSPAEVEREIDALDGVALAVVVGVDDDGTRGQIVTAAVLLTPGAALCPEEIQHHLQCRLSSYKVPRSIVVFHSIDDIPMTPSMKVRKRELAALIRSRIETQN